VQLRKQRTPKFYSLPVYEINTGRVTKNLLGLAWSLHAGNLFPVKRNPAPTALRILGCVNVNTRLQLRGKALQEDRSEFAPLHSCLLM
jgi:hypothetical protein